MTRVGRVCGGGDGDVLAFEYPYVDHADTERTILEICQKKLIACDVPTFQFLCRCMAI